MPPAVAVQNIGVRPCWGEACCDTRIAPSQPNEDSVNCLTRPELARFVGLDSKLFSKVQVDSKEDWAKKLGARHHQSLVIESKNCTFSLAAKSSESPCSAATFVVNSEPHTGESPSVRLCVGLIKEVDVLYES